MLRILVHMFSDKVPKIDKNLSGLWYSMVWPGSEVKLAHHSCLSSLQLDKKPNTSEFINLIKKAVYLSVCL